MQPACSVGVGMAGERTGRGPVISTAWPCPVEVGGAAEIEGQ